MISKNLLLAGIAAGALAFASQANAIVIAALTSGAAGADTSVTGTTGGGADGGFTSNNPYLLAQELNYTNGVTSAQGGFTTAVKIGQTLPQSTTFSISITYAGATLNANSAAGDLTFLDGTGAATTGTGMPTNVTANGAGGTGNAGSSTATYTFTTGSTSTLAFINIAPPLNVKNGGNVTMTVTLNDQSGNPVGNSPTATAQLIKAAQGLKLIIASDNVPTFATPTSTPVYSALSTAGGSDAIIGSVALLANNIPGSTNGTIYGNLTGTAISPVNAISTENITVFGNFSALNVTGNNGATFGAPVNGTEFTTFGGPQTSTTVGGNTGAIETISVVHNGITGAAIPPSAYNATASVVLNNGIFGGGTINSSPNGALQTVNRQGYSVIVPWVASATQAGGSGSTSTIRVSSINSGSTAGAGGDVYAEVINGIGQTRTGIAYMGTLASGGEVVISSTQLQQMLGDFTRADIRITVDTAGSTGLIGSPQPNGIIVKRQIVRPSGITEMLNVNESGTAMDLNTTVGGSVAPGH